MIFTNDVPNLAARWANVGPGAMVMLPASLRVTVAFAAHQSGYADQALRAPQIQNALKTLDGARTCPSVLCEGVLPRCIAALNSALKEICMNCTVVQLFGKTLTDYNPRRK